MLFSYLNVCKETWPKWTQMSVCAAWWWLHDSPASWNGTSDTMFFRERDSLCSPEERQTLGNSPTSPPEFWKNWYMPLYPTDTVFSTMLHLGYFHSSSSDVISGGWALCHLCEQVRCALLTPHSALLPIFFYMARVSHFSSQAKPRNIPSNRTQNITRSGVLTCSWLKGKKRDNYLRPASLATVMVAKRVLWSVKVAGASHRQ